MSKQSYLDLVVGVLVVMLGAIHSKPLPHDYLVHGFDAYGIDEEMYAGFMPIRSHERNDEGSLFFWMIMQDKDTREQSTNKDDTLIVWLNGGPACSSILGMLYENGPFVLKDSVNGTHTFMDNIYSWNKLGHVLYVEQPLRTGFSEASKTADKVASEYQVAVDFRGFLSSFFEVFENFESYSVYITGESYAGFYVPWISYHITQKQMKQDYESIYGPLKHINLEGIAIGNGGIDALIQVSTYSEFMYINGFIPRGAKEYFENKYHTCIDHASYANSPITWGTVLKCQVLYDVLTASGYPNVYNVNTYNSYDSMFAKAQLFMNDPRVQTLIHAKGRNIPGINFIPEGMNISELNTTELKEYIPKYWNPINLEVYIDMLSDHPMTSVPALNFLSKHIRVMLYSGASDLSMNTIGTIHTLESHSWHGRQWSESTRGLMVHDGTAVGDHYQLGNLSLFIVRNAGHMVPMDQPSTALEMMRRFICRESFVDIPLYNDAFYLSQHVESYDDDTSAIDGGLFMKSVNIEEQLLVEKVESRSARDKAFSIGVVGLSAFFVLFVSFVTIQLVSRRERIYRRYYIPISSTSDSSI